MQHKESLHYVQFAYHGRSVQKPGLHWNNGEAALRHSQLFLSVQDHHVLN